MYPEGYSTGPADDDEEFHQQALIHEQDEQLEGVSYTVGNLRQQAREMGDELEDQVMYLSICVVVDNLEYWRILTNVSRVHIRNCGGERSGYNILYWRMKVRNTFTRSDVQNQSRIIASLRSSLCYLFYCLW
jgi:hypothetical protein